MNAMPNPDPTAAVRALAQAMLEAAEAASRRGHVLCEQAAKQSQIGRSLIAQAEQLKEGAKGLNGLAEFGPAFARTQASAPAPAPPPVRPAPPAPPAPAKRPEPAPEPPAPEPLPPAAETPDPRVSEDDGERSVGTKGAVTLASAAKVAKTLKQFSRKQFGEAAGLPMIGASKWVSRLATEGIVKPTDDGTFVYVEPTKQPIPGTTPVVTRDPVADVERSLRERTAPEVPEHLRDFPAAKGGGPVTQRIKAAEGQKAVLDVVIDRATVGKTTVMNEIARDLGEDFSTERIQRYLRDLVGAGLIRPTGKHRFDERKPPGAGGHTATEYKLVPVAEPKVAPKEPERPKLAAVPPPPAPVVPKVDQPTIRRVEDWCKTQEKVFSLEQIATATELDREAVKVVMGHLEAVNKVVDESPGPDLLLWRWSPGGQATPKPKVAPTPKRGAPVAGTGRGIKVKDKGVQETIDAAIKAGADVSQATSGHYAVVFAVTDPDTGQDKQHRILIAGTPKSSRTVMNDRGRLRRAGLAV